MGTWIALGAALAAWLGVAVNFVKLRQERNRLADERDRWERERRAELFSSFLRDLVHERLRLYPPVFELVGHVYDIDPRSELERELRKTPDQLLAIATELHSHLYGEAGLVMSMGTRNTLLDVWEGCHDFHDGRITIRELSDRFTFGRRLLRADLQLEDMRELPTELRGLVSTFRTDYDELSMSTASVGGVGRA